MTFRTPSDSSKRTPGRGITEANRTLDQLEAEHGTEVFEAVTDVNPINPFTRIPEFATILRQRGYRLVAQDRSSGLRLWRQTRAVEGS